MNKASAIHVYEGLPHQRWESKALAREKGRADVIEVEGFPFYTPFEVATTDDAKQLAKLVSSHSSFRKYSPGKRCGGFHPDYLIEWKHGRKVYHCLVCFGCGEVKLSRVGLGKMLDISQKAEAKFKALLTNYGGKRPPSSP